MGEDQRDNVKNRKTQEEGTNDRNLAVLHDLVNVGKDSSPSESTGLPPICPTNFEVNDANLMTAGPHPLQKVMALVGAFRHPVRFLKNEDAHRIELAAEYAEGTSSRRLEFGGLPDVVPVFLEPRVNVPQARFEVSPRFVVQKLLSLFNRSKETVLGVPAASLLEHNPRFVSSELVHPRREIEDPDFPSSREVDRLADGLLGRRTRSQPIDDVSDVGEVPGLLTRPRDGQRLTVHSPMEEVR